MIIKKRIAFLAVIAIMAVSLNAQERGFVFSPFFSGGGGTVVFDGFGGYGIGGIGEFALLFYDNNLQVGAHLTGRGDSIFTADESRYGAGSITAKISLGGFFANNVTRGYSFVEGGIGFGGGISVDGSNSYAAFNVIFGGGGGIDFFFLRNGSIYLEVGYLQHFINNELVGGISITLGARSFFGR